MHIRIEAGILAQICMSDTIIIGLLHSQSGVEFWVTPHGIEVEHSTYIPLVSISTI